MTDWTQERITSFFLISMRAIDKRARAHAVWQNLTVSNSPSKPATRLGHCRDYPMIYVVEHTFSKPHLEGEWNLQGLPGVTVYDPHGERLTPARPQ